MSSVLPCQTTSRPDEIDLAQLVLLLWRNKIRIALCLLVGLAAGAIHATISPGQWTSKAYVQKPGLMQIQAHLEQRRALARLDGTASPSAETLSAALFQRHLETAWNMHNRQAYLGSSSYFRERTRHMDGQEAHQLLTRLAESSLQMKAIEDDGPAPYYRISFTAESAEQARELLSSYLASMDVLALALTEQEFKDQVSDRIQSRQYSLSSLAFTLEAERKYRIDRLDNALHVAARAGLEHYADATHHDGSTVIEVGDRPHLFMLGEQFLRAKLSGERDKPLLYPARHALLERELTELQALHKTPVKAVSYAYQLAPTLPERQDGPGRVLISALGAMLGGMAGCAWILAGHILVGRPSGPARPDAV